MDPQTFTASVFPVLFVMVAVWMVLVRQLFRRLEREHPQKYEAMGRPSLFLRNNIYTGWATLKFLVGREHRSLNDRNLSRLSDLMLAFFAIYVALFIGFAFAVAGFPASLKASRRLVRPGPA